MKHPQSLSKAITLIQKGISFPSPIHFPRKWFEKRLACLLLIPQRFLIFFFFQKGLKMQCYFSSFCKGTTTMY